MELIPGVVTEWMLQKVTLKVGDEFTPWSAEEWIGWIRAEREGELLARGQEKRWTKRLQARLGQALAYAELSASGALLSGGGLVRIPCNAWLMARYADGPSHADQFELALAGSPIFAKVPSSEECWPMVALSDLAVWAGASIHFEQPKIVPTEIAPEDETGADAAKRGSQVELPAALPSAPPARSGRVPTHDWDAFWIEVVNWTAINIGTEGLRQSDRTELQEHMAKWTAENPPRGGEAMTSTTVRLKLQRLFKGKP